MVYCRRLPYLRLHGKDADVIGAGTSCGCNSVAEWKLPKLHTWVRFPSPAQEKSPL